MSSDLRERVARAIYESRMIPGDFHWDDLDAKARAYWLQDADAVLAELRSSGLLATDSGLTQSSEAAVAEPVAWEGAEEWMPLAWELCAEEHGEDACNDLLWEGGPVPEPWGERWLQYEDEAKRLISLVQKHAPQPQAERVDDAVLVPRDTLLDFKAWFSTESPLGIHLRKRVDELLSAPHSRPQAINGYTDDDRARIVSAMQSMRDRLGGFLTAKYGDQFDGDLDTLLDAINWMKRNRPAAPQPQPQVRAEDMALVDEGMSFVWSAEHREAWQRIRASLGVGK